MFKRTLFAAALFTSAASFIAGPASAQDIATRILNIENQMRDLTGQLEELNFSMKQLQKQIAAGGSQSGSLEPVFKAPAKPSLKKLAAEQGIEQIGDPEDAVPQQKRAVITGAEQVEDLNNQAATTPAVTNDAEAAIGEDAAVASAVPAIGADDAATGDSIEQVSLTPQAETPEAVYERWYEALLRRQFPEAETGFKDFLAKYPEHSLAGSAQFQLGETFYAQADYEGAARNFLQGYKNYPKSRRAPDSLLKLGMSLKKMGQKEQACAALGSVGAEFPRAVEVKKRATAEFKRNGC